MPRIDLEPQGVETQGNREFHFLKSKLVTFSKRVFNFELQVS